MGTTRKTMAGRNPQDKRIGAQIEAGDLTNHRENIGDLIRCDQARSAEIDAIREALIRGKQSGEARPFFGGAFTERMTAKRADEAR